MKNRWFSRHWVKYIPMEFCVGSGFAYLWTHCVWFDRLGQHVSFVVLWLFFSSYWFLFTHWYTQISSSCKGAGKNYMEYSSLRLPKWISEFKCPFSCYVALYWSTLTIFLYGIPFPKISPSVPLKLFIQKKWGNLVNETVKGSFFITELTTIMIGLLFS